MTVIAFKDGVIASDSQVTEDDGLITLDDNKLFRNKAGVVMGASGSVDMRELLLDFEEWESPEFIPCPESLKIYQINFAGILAFPKKKEIYTIVIEFDEEGKRWEAWSYKISGSPLLHACGTGGVLARGAMLAGLTATEAVELTINNHAYCGGVVKYEKVW